MIGLPANTPIYLCTTPVDFRKGFDGLTGIVTNSLGHNVTDGALFLFVNRKQDRIKALWWETGGLTLWYRRLEQGTVELPKETDNAAAVAIDSVELAIKDKLVEEQAHSVLELKSHTDQLDAKITELNLTIEKLLRQLYGRKSERRIDDAGHPPPRDTLIRFW